MLTSVHKYIDPVRKSMENHLTSNNVGRKWTELCGVHAYATRKQMGIMGYSRSRVVVILVNEAYSQKRFLDSKLPSDKFRKLY